MSERRRTPLQRAESRQAKEPEQDQDEFRNMMRRRQEAEEKLRRHLESERDGRRIPPEELAGQAAGTSASTDPPAGARIPEEPGARSAARSPD